MVNQNSNEYNEYHKVELPALNQLQKLGWNFIEGKNFLPNEGERKSLKDVVLENRLYNSIKKNNEWISEENLKKVIKDITQLKTSPLLESNQYIWNTLVNYISVEQDLGKGRRGQTVKIIDFDVPENNEFLCVNQFKIEGPEQNIIPDIILFVNGLPLGVIECKSPYITNPMESGIDQLMRYMNRRNSSDNEDVKNYFFIIK